MNPQWAPSRPRLPAVDLNGLAVNGRSLGQRRVHPYVAVKRSQSPVTPERVCGGAATERFDLL